MFLFLRMVASGGGGKEDFDVFGAFAGGVVQVVAGNLIHQGTQFIQMHMDLPVAGIECLKRSQPVMCGHSEPTLIFESLIFTAKRRAGVDPNQPFPLYGLPVSTIDPSFP